MNECREAPADWFRLIPKVELHVHTEGAIPLPALLTLIGKYAGGVESLDELERRFRYVDFPHFLATWMWKNQFLREYEDFRHIAEGVAASLASDGVVYAEAFFSPSDFAAHGLEPAGLAEAIRAGFDAVPAIRINLVADLVRNNGAADAERVLDQVSEARSAGVIGVGIGGDEAGFPAHLFSDAFERARRLGFHTSAHAGEGDGAQSVRSAILDLAADRIGHATRATEDPSTVALIEERKVPLEMCPVSNVRTGVAPSLRDHPVRELFDRGILVSVNTDDPAMFHTSLPSELAALHRELGFTADEIRRLQLNAVDSSWLPAEEKSTLRRRIGSDPLWHRPPFA